MKDFTFFKKDIWLTEQLSKPAFTYQGGEIEVPNRMQFKTELHSLIGKFDNPFIQGKVNTDSINHVRLFEENRFNLIDTNVQFQKKLDYRLEDQALNRESEIRLATQADRESVMAIAYSNFTLSRFHLDPNISNEVANQIKREWVGNYFSGNRGDNMVVSVTDGTVSGFVQLLEKKDHYIIDLISVDKIFQRRGLASAMLKYCDFIYRNLDYALVGTQISNHHSINLYLKHNYQVFNSKYVFHFNQTDSIPS